MSKEVFLNDINEDLFNKQRKTLQKHISNLKAGKNFNIAITNDLEEIEALLDEISDQLYYQNEKD